MADVSSTVVAPSEVPQFLRHIVKMYVKYCSATSTYGYPDTPLWQIEYLMHHTTAGAHYMPEQIQQLYDVFRNQRNAKGEIEPWSRPGYKLIIFTDGTVVQTSPFPKIKDNLMYHNHNTVTWGVAPGQVYQDTFRSNLSYSSYPVPYNQNTFHISWTGGHKSFDMNRTQKEVMLALTKELMTRFPNLKLVGHNMVEQTYKECVEYADKEKKECLRTRDVPYYKQCPWYRVHDVAQLLGFPLERVPPFKVGAPNLSPFKGPNETLVV